jgi:hypothetical protein
VPPFSATYGFTVRLGPADECGDDIYWVTIRINGKTIKKTMSPGDADSYSEVVQQTLGADVKISANAYLPILSVQSSAATTSSFPDECPCIIPSPYETTVTDRISGASSHSGSAYSEEYYDCVMNNINYIPRCSVVSGGVDDYGKIGGVHFENQTVTQNPDGTYKCSGLTQISGPVEVAVIKDGNRLRVDWSITNSPFCGLGTAGPCGLVGVTFKFYWEQKNDSY